MSATRLGFDPRAIPVAGTDAHLPAVPAERLQPDPLRRRFADRSPWTPEWPGDNARLDIARGPTPAAVLVPLVQRPEGLRVLLTERTAHLRDHAGQVSFPGGRVDPGDAHAVDTALREAEEEIGLARRQVEVLGELPVYATVTNFQVTPVVALVEPPSVLTLDAFEVAEAFEVPLEFLMTPAHHRRHEFEFNGLPRRFLSMPWHGAPDAAATLREYFIWGATAAMLRNLYRFLMR
ncbi:MAG TPA: CoA pyrophosphatase [Rubrivivax sp.]|nr:CoA pyrophosphatase [Burkholderiaceae bacterium]HMQ71513.1 CoA pyrophosphatase [Rubrivivax sp.]